MVELGCAVALGALLWVGGRAALETAQSEIAEASAAARPYAGVELDRDLGQLDRVPRVELFEGVSDEVLLAPLRTGAIREVKFNRGGSSISLRLELDNGARAAFKPLQTNLHSIPRYEIAAYRINRMLGLSSVAPAIGRSLPVADLLASLRPDSVGFRSRIEAEMIHDGAEVAGELSWWIPVIVPPTVGEYIIDSTEGVMTWGRYLGVDAVVPHEDLSIIGQISDMVIFDFVIDNNDRWSGSNVWSSTDGRTLYFMDNTLSFGRDREGDGTSKTRTYLHKVEKFSRILVASLRQLSAEAIRAEMEIDRGPFEVLLTDDEIRNVMKRRRFALDYIDGLIEKHGAEAVLVFP
jgi:hypothetical protein